MCTRIIKHIEGELEVEIHYYPNSMKYLGGGKKQRRSGEVTATHVAIVGLGYVGLPTALSLHRAGFKVSGFDIDQKRLDAIRSGRIDGASVSLSELELALSGSRFTVSSDAAVLGDADVVLIAVPTPVDESRTPNVGPLESACNTYVAAARHGQTVILTSTTYVGCTTSLLTVPLRLAGFEVGEDVHVVFSPERLNPGSESHTQSDVPRVIGGATDACTHAAAEVLRPIASSVHFVSSPEVAEMTKLVENTFRAVNIALANEFAEAASVFEIDVREVLDASASKPYGFMPFRPGPGVGGHCIPCDPHYLLWGLHAERVYAPVMEQAMVSISSRPMRVAERIQQVLARDGRAIDGARIVLIGMAYKPGVQDLRESPSLAIASLLRRQGANVAAFDPLFDGSIFDDDGVPIELLDEVDVKTVDLAVVLNDHSEEQLEWIDGVPRVLDASFSLECSDRVVSL